MGRWSEHIGRDLADAGTLPVLPHLTFLLPTGDIRQDHQHTLALSQTTVTAIKLIQLFEDEFRVGFTIDAVPKQWKHVACKYRRSPENGFRRGCVQLAEHARDLPSESPFRSLMEAFANAALASHYAHRAAALYRDSGEHAVLAFIDAEYRANRLHNGAGQRLLQIYPRDASELVTLRQRLNAVWCNQQDGGLRHLLEQQRQILAAPSVIRS